MKRFFFGFFVSLFCLSPGNADEILARVGDVAIRAQQLEQAMSAAPFATQFPALDRPEQAKLRGEMLSRIVQSEVLYQEAVDQELDQAPEFVSELDNFELTLLAKRYTDALRAEVVIPENLREQFKAKYQGNGDALAAAESVYIAKHFKTLKASRIANLKKFHQITIDENRLHQPLYNDSVLLKGNGISIRYADLIDPNTSQKLDVELLREKLNTWLNVLLFARAARDSGIEVQDQLSAYRRGLLIKQLIDRQEDTWLSQDEALLDYFQKHPELGIVPERREIGQIVVSSNELAEDLRRRIMNGTSLFELAAEYSIDPYGRQHAGDMGWLPQGSGMPELEKVLDSLPDHQVSEVIATSKGYHLVMIVNRLPEERKTYAAIKDRVKRAFLAEKWPGYIKQVMARHPVVWTLPDHFQTAASQFNKSSVSHDSGK